MSTTQDLTKHKTNPNNVTYMYNAQIDEFEYELCYFIVDDNVFGA